MTLTLNDPAQESLARKLNPNRFTKMSPKMAAIVGCILGEQFTDPQLASLIVTSDGFVMGRLDGDCGYNEWIGGKPEMNSNWERLLVAADLTDAEKALADRLYLRSM